MLKFYPVKNQRIGILGGGQLARMIVEAALPLGLSVNVLAKQRDVSCHFLNPLLGDLNDLDTVFNFGRQCDVLTFEFENISLEAIEALSEKGVIIAPSASLMRLAQDKGRQKAHFASAGYPTPEYTIIDHVDPGVADFISATIGFPAIQKARSNGYDGRGVHALNSPEDLTFALDGPSIIEKKVDLDYELATIVAGNGKQIKAFPPVRLNFCPKSHILSYLRTLFEPEEKLIAKKAQKIALDFARNMKLRGLVAIEFLVSKSGELTINEIAPRPHNSGHHTIEGNWTSQYRQLLLGLLGEPLGKVDPICHSAMVNLIGEYDLNQLFKKTTKMKRTYLHWYQKNPEPNRKTGHITTLAKNPQKMLSNLKEIVELEKACRI